MEMEHIEATETTDEAAPLTEAEAGVEPIDRQIEADAHAAPTYPTSRVVEAPMDVPEPPASVPSAALEMQPPDTDAAPSCEMPNDASRKPAAAPLPPPALTRIVQVEDGQHDDEPHKEDDSRSQPPSSPPENMNEELADDVPPAAAGGGSGESRPPEPPTGGSGPEGTPDPEEPEEPNKSGRPPLSRLDQRPVPEQRLQLVTFAGDPPENLKQLFSNSVINAELPPPEVARPIEHELDEAIEGLRDCRLEQAAHLGLDASERLPTSQEVKVYTPAEFEHLRTIYSQSSAAGALTIRSGAIACEVSPDDAVTLQRIDHALGVAMTGQTVEIVETQAGWQMDSKQFGYADIRTGEGAQLTAGLVELGRIDAERNYWLMNPKLRGHLARPAPLVNRDMLIVLDGVLEKAADPKAAYEELHRNMLLGDKQGLHVIEDVIGTEAAGRMSRMRTDLDVLDFAARLDNDEFADTKRRLNDRDAVGMFSWL